MSKTVVIIGAGAEQVPAYLAAKARGLTVVGTDMNPQAPGLAHADIAVLASTRDCEQTLSALQQALAGRPVHGVMTIANDVPYTVAYVASHLGLPGISLAAAQCVSHKLRMKEAFQQHQVACPWFSTVRDVAHLRELLASGVSDWFVIKPVDGLGARGVLRINQGSDVDWAYHESQRWGESGELLLEAFVPGMQLSTESFLVDGRCYTPAISERNYEFLERFSPYIIENGGTIPAPLSAQQLRAIDDLIVAGAAAMGVRDGIVKGDLIIGPDGQPLIVELALRLSGGWFATHQIPAASGVDLVAAVMSHALGEPVDEAALRPSRQAATAVRYWFPPSGTIQAIHGEGELAQVEGLISYGFFRGVGDVQPEVKMHPDRFGFVIVAGENREQALARVHDGLSRVTVEVAS